jgi:hypothetical protein
LIKTATRMVWEAELPDDKLPSVIVSGSRNAKLSMTTNADFLSKKKDGGKLSSASKLLQVIFPQKIYNLETGEPTGQEISFADVENGKFSPAEAIFQHSFQEFLSVYRGGENLELFAARAVAVSIQGKYRIATSSHFLHASFLQPAMQVLKSGCKRIESTSASFSKGNQAWEFVKKIEPWMLPAFTDAKSPITGKNLKFFCSDWEMATDALLRQSCAITVDETARYLGLPNLYRQMVVWAFTHPRLIFLPTGIGEDLPTSFVSTRGVLQGDPITKVALQLTHTVSRIVARRRLRTAAQHSIILRSNPRGREAEQTAKWSKVNLQEEELKQKKSESIFGKSTKRSAKTAEWELIKSVEHKEPSSQQYGRVPSYFIKLLRLEEKRRLERGLDARDENDIIKAHLSSILVQNPEETVSLQKANGLRGALAGLFKV